VNPKLLEVLVCPVCKSQLEHDRSADELICRPDLLAFAIRDGIPVMLIEQARRLGDSPDAPIEPNAGSLPPNE
jgi:uncharacterized protein